MKLQILLLMSVVWCVGCSTTSPSTPASVNASKTVTQTTTPASTEVSLAGTFRCWQFNVDGYGGSCRTLSPIVLAADGSYSISTTTGKYTVTAGTITLSESQYWGAGMVKESGQQIYFNYTYQNKHYEVTYLRQ